VALKAEILRVFATLTTAEVLDRLDAAPIANARMNDMQGLWAHPQLSARQRWQAVPSPAGEIPALIPPGVHSAFDYRMDAIPALGEHTQALLAELGMASEEIEALRGQGIV